MISICRGGNVKVLRKDSLIRNLMSVLSRCAKSLSAKFTHSPSSMTISAVTAVVLLFAVGLQVRFGSELLYTANLYGDCDSSKLARDT